MVQSSYFRDYILKKKKKQTTQYIGYTDKNSYLTSFVAAKTGNSLNVYLKGKH